MEEQGDTLYCVSIHDIKISYIQAKEQRFDCCSSSQIKCGLQQGVKSQLKTTINVLSYCTWVAREGRYGFTMGFTM